MKSVVQRFVVGGRLSRVLHVIAARGGDAAMTGVEQCTPHTLRCHCGVVGYCPHGSPIGRVEIISDGFRLGERYLSEGSHVTSTAMTWTYETRSPKQPCVYILASRRNGTLYTGVTSDLLGRMSDHKQGLHDGFSKTYGVTQLGYYEMQETMTAAITRETRIKKWRRAWKVRLIESMNPEWVDLFDDKFVAIKDGPADFQRFRML